MADVQLGVRLLVAAVSIRAAPSVGLRRLAKAYTDNAGLPAFFSSHPPLAERVRRLEQSPS